MFTKTTFILLEDLLVLKKQSKDDSSYLSAKISFNQKYGGFCKTYNL